MAIHTQNEQTTGICEGGQLVPAVATKPLPGEINWRQTTFTPDECSLTTRGQSGTNQPPKDEINAGRQDREH